jgi:hypothetical protein
MMIVAVVEGLILLGKSRGRQQNETLQSQQANPTALTIGRANTNEYTDAEVGLTNIDPNDPLGLGSIPQPPAKKPWSATLVFFNVKYGVNVYQDPATLKLYYTNGRNIYEYHDPTENLPKTPEVAYPDPAYAPYTPHYTSIYSHSSEIQEPSPVSVYQSRIGNYTYLDAYSGGESAHATSTRIGNTTWANGYDNEGNSFNGTSTSVGNTVYHNFYFSDGSTLNGTSTRIGNFIYTDLY